ncbi:putative zinc transporter protein [Hibiscus syriacus]|uniref:Zinc transporter protein n=1 Tax=Hibiscus syriacus TaxID=106335 RepID=A0A6A2Z3L6_HIBSY|nr:putative zinc transporter protein [Hibiscus syriacus]
MASQSGSGTGSNSGSESISTSQNENLSPLWNYVRKIEKRGTVGGTWNFRYNICGETRNGSYTRIKEHLLQISGEGVAICKKVTRNQKLEMVRLVEEWENRKKQEVTREVSLPSQSSAGIEIDSSSKKRKPSLSPLARAFDMNTRAQLDEEIARMFYTGGLPFNLARNPHYHRAFTFATTHNIPGYVPPGYNKLQTTLLQQEKNNVEKLLQPIKATWQEKGLTIVCDGWSDPTRKPLINFMDTSGNGPMFLKAVNCFGEVKDKFFIANLMKEVIDEVGHQNVVQIITDNAANCKGAGEIIESMYPHIYWTPCVVHTLNLALKNICSEKNVDGNEETYDLCHWITDIHGDAVQIKNFIMNHNMRLVIFQRFSPLRLLSVVDTRFASIIVMLKRFKLIKQGLQAMVISDEWNSYREDDMVKANFVKEKLVSDDWWDKVAYILDFTKPIYDMLRVCDTDKPCLHLVYELWDSMIEKSYTPLHCLAHSLNPRFYSDGWLSEDPCRVAPHRDGEISRERMKCFRRLFPNDDDYDKVLDEFACFSLKLGPFEDLMSLTRGISDLKSWWANFGAEIPLLQSLAFKVLGQPTSSSCCERNWSTYSFIHSLRRNKLNPSRAEDLVYIHYNLRLLSRSSSQYEDEKPDVDVCGDAFDSLGDVGYLEFAELSLDESDLESQLISEDVNNV